MAFVDFYDYGEDEAYEISFAQYKLQYTEVWHTSPHLLHLLPAVHALASVDVWDHSDTEYALPSTSCSTQRWVPYSTNFRGFPG